MPASGARAFADLGDSPIDDGEPSRHDFMAQNHPGIFENRVHRHPIARQKAQVDDGDRRILGVRPIGFGAEKLGKTVAINPIRP